MSTRHCDDKELKQEKKTSKRFLIGSVSQERRVKEGNRTHHHHLLGINVLQAWKWKWKWKEQLNPTFMSYILS